MKDIFSEDVHSIILVLLQLKPLLGLIIRDYHRLYLSALTPVKLSVLGLPRHTQTHTVSSVSRLTAPSLLFRPLARAETGALPSCLLPEAVHINQPAQVPNQFPS